MSEALDRTARFLDPGMLASEHNRVFLAWEDGRAVGPGTAWSLLGTVGVFGIAMVERARGRGIGAALTSTAAHAFGDEVDLAWPHPTDLARPLYERLGFRAVADCGHLGPAVLGGGKRLSGVARILARVTVLGGEPAVPCTRNPLSRG